MKNLGLILFGSMFFISSLSLAGVGAGPNANELCGVLSSDHAGSLVTASRTYLILPDAGAGVDAQLSPEEWVDQMSKLYQLRDANLGKSVILKGFVGTGDSDGQMLYSSIQPVETCP